MSGMIVRNPRPDEVEQAAHVASQAFPDRPLEDWLRDFARNARLFGERFILVVESGGRIISCLICTPSPVYIRGRPVAHSAVGAVGTLPEFRRRGSASAMMCECVKLLRREGVLLSSLWPFSYEFYRRFGYEIGAENRVYKAAAEVFAGLGSTEGVRRAEPGDLHAIEKLYAATAPSRNCLTRRSHDWWREVAGADRWLNPDFSSECGAVVSERGGEVDAYAVYHVKREDGRMEIGIREMMFSHAAHRRGVLAYLAAVEPEAQIVLYTHGRDPFLLELSDPRGVECSVVPSFQFRVVDPKNALLALDADPGVSEKLSFFIGDPVFKEGFEFGIDVDGGRISECPPTSRFRMEMDIGVFAGIYSGCMEPADAYRAGRLRISGGTQHVLAALARLFGGFQPYRSGLEPG